MSKTRCALALRDPPSETILFAQREAVPPKFRSHEIALKSVLPGTFSPFSKVALRLQSSTPSRSSWRQDEFFASVLFLSSRHMVAPQFEDFPGFDGVACRTSLLLGRARSTKSGVVFLSMTIL
jgi:hypothetical protein